jgi:glutathione S-transferase
MLAHHREVPNAMSASDPLLWHLEVSHYSEKARWALDYKGIPHRRRAPLPGSHIPIAFVLTRGAQTTFPVLRIDGRAVGDSTAVIAALEERFPEPPLYPAGELDRRRALELEDFFDEELGPHVRLLLFHELARDEERFIAAMERTAPGPLAKGGRATIAYARALTGLRWGVHDEQAAELARAKILAGFERLEQELGEGDHLVGDSFTVADLTAAALLNPLVLPQEGPLPADEPPPRGLEQFRAGVEGRRGFAWVEETYARHRRPAMAAAPA